MKVKECSIADTATVIIKVSGSNREILRAAEAYMMAEIGSKDFRDVKNTEIVHRLMLDGHNARRKRK